MDEKFRQKIVYYPHIREAATEDRGEIDVSSLPPDALIVRTVFSAISSGTDKAQFHGMRVNGLSDEAIAHPEKSFPRYPGYAGSGVVVWTGSAVKTIKTGDRVAYFWGNNFRYQITRESRGVLLNDSVDFTEGAFTFISTFPLAAVRKLRIEVGESALVMGLGILGQFAVRYARIAGAAPVIAADPNPERRKLALEGGADYALDPLADGFDDEVKRLTGGGVNAAVEVTGVGAGLNETLRVMAKFGRIALLGCTRDSHFEIDWYKMVHCPGIKLIGAHTNARPTEESSAGLWTHLDDMKTYLRLIAGGRLNVKPLISEVHAPDEAPEVYKRLGFDPNFPVGVLFDWRLDPDKD